MDRYRKEVLQVSTRKHGINVQYLYDKNFDSKTKEIAFMQKKLHSRAKNATASVYNLISFLLLDVILASH